VVAADAIPVTNRWHGFDSTFGHASVSGLAGLIVCGFVARALNGRAPIRSDRDLARKRACRSNAACMLALVLLVSLAHLWRKLLRQSDCLTSRKLGRARLLLRVLVLLRDSSPSSDPVTLCTG
jgi:hypothetical protein